MTIEWCYCGQIKPHARKPECEKPRVRLETCGSRKMGEYNPLRCIRDAGHAGDHNYIVDGSYDNGDGKHG